MCNKYVQDELIIKPGGRTYVKMRGPGGEFELPFTEAVFGGSAKRESRGWWKSKEGAEVQARSMVLISKSSNCGGAL